jgi:hypothetical protein
MPEGGRPLADWDSKAIVQLLQCKIAAATMSRKNAFLPAPLASATEPL